MIHNLFWQKWQGHGPFENLMKDTAIDSAVLAALQPVFLLGGRAEFSRRHSPPPPAMISPLPGDWWTEQGHTRHPWPGLGFLRVRARLGDCGRVASTTAQPWASRGVEADAPKCRLVRGSALLPWLVVWASCPSLHSEPKPLEYNIFSSQWMKLVTFISSQEL